MATPHPNQSSLPGIHEQGNAAANRPDHRRQKEPARLDAANHIRSGVRLELDEGGRGGGRRLPKALLLDHGRPEGSATCPLFSS